MIENEHNFIFAFIVVLIGLVTAIISFTYIISINYHKSKTKKIKHKK